MLGGFAEDEGFEEPLLPNISGDWILNRVSTLAEQFGVLDEILLYL